MSWNPLSGISSGFSALRDGKAQIGYLIDQLDILDQDATKPLKDCLKSLKSLKNQYEQKRTFEGPELSAAITDLQVITSHHEPHLILAPYVDKDKLDEAQKNSQETQEQCRGLLKLLQERNTPRMHPPTDEILLQQLLDTYKTLQDMQEVQLGPAAKLCNFVVDRIETEFQRALGNAPKEPSLQKVSIASEHPLIQLLSLLGKYENTLQFPDHRKKELANALFELNDYSSHFKGMKAAVFQDGLPTENAEIFLKISLFLKKVFKHAEVLDDESKIKHFMEIFEKASAAGIEEAKKLFEQNDGQAILHWTEDFMGNTSNPYANLMHESEICLMEIFEKASANGIEETKKLKDAGCTQAIMGWTFEFIQRDLRELDPLLRAKVDKNLMDFFEKASAAGIEETQNLKDADDTQAIMEWTQNYLKTCSELNAHMSKMHLDLAFTSVSHFVFSHMRDELDAFDPKLERKLIQEHLLQIFCLTHPRDRHVEPEAKIKAAHEIVYQPPTSRLLQIFESRYPLDKTTTREARIEAAHEIIAADPTKRRLHKLIEFVRLKEHELENRQKTKECLEKLNYTDTQTAWGAEVIQKGDNLPFMDRILWIAMAHHEELGKCWTYYKEINDPTEGKKEDLAQNLEDLNSLLERQPQLLENGNKLMEKVQYKVWGWIDKAQTLMKEQKGADELDIDRKFRKVLEMLRKEDFLEAIRYTQRLVEESPLGLDMWRGEDVASPRSLLESTLNDFCMVDPPQAPPKSAETVKKKLGIDEDTRIENWEAKWKEVIDKEQDKLVTNTCGSNAFKFGMTWLVRKDEDETAALYKNVIHGLEHVAGEGQNYAGKDLDDRIRQALAWALNKRVDQISEKSVQDIKTSLNEVRGAGLLDDQKRKQLHETLYFSLVWSILEDQSEAPAFVNRIIHFIITMVYTVSELFIRPFAASLLESLRKDVILHSNGTLTETHLIPIKSLGRGLESFVTAKKAWPELKKQQATGKDNPVSERILIGKLEQEAMENILDNPLYYHGYDPREIDREIGYLAVDHFLRISENLGLPELRAQTLEWHQQIYDAANAFEIENPESYLDHIVNYTTIALKHIISLVPHAIALLTNLILKVSESVLDFSGQQIAKWIIWQFDIVTNMLDQMTDSLFNNTYHTPVMDELLLEQLEELEKQILKDSQEERGGALEHESPVVKRQIREAFAHLFEAIEIESRDTSQEVELTSDPTTYKFLKTEAQKNLQELLTSLLVVSSQSFLNQSQMNEILLKTLNSANEGLRGKTSTLEDADLQRLTAELGRPPTDKEKKDELEKQAVRAQGKTQGEISRRFTNILDNGVNPMVQRRIDESVKSSSDRLFEYAAWMERRLFSYPGEESTSKRNIIHMLKQKLDDLKTEPDLKKQDQLLREIHEEYTTFIQEFIAKQQTVDQTRISSVLKMNKFVKQDVETYLKTLNEQLMILFKPQGKQADRIIAAKETLEKLETNLIKKRETFNKIKRSEQSRAEGMHKGIEGLAKKVVIQGKEIIKDQVTPIAQNILNAQIKNLEANTQRIYGNRVLIKHLCRHQMLGYIEASRSA